MQTISTEQEILCVDLDIRTFVSNARWRRLDREPCLDSAKLVTYIEISVLTKVIKLPRQYPVVRGMVSYALIWPCCSLTQEYLEFGTPLSEANWARAARFGFFGAFCMSPVFYSWMKYSSRFFRKKTLKTAIKRALIEQVSYGPLALAYFLFGMSLLEMRPLQECVDEVKQKFWSTYKAGAVYWPTTQTINFYFISEKNRIIFVSIMSFIWTVYLAHVKSHSNRNTGINVITATAKDAND